ncbi:hypothetical protein [Psychrobacillus sp. FJAT-21963]|uniref:hypothetical protein n=1 Tax=Psychrobacillus sp. FJAT-21963 TaxID=1712028 RepID=UPI0006F35A83|nr:hypothetical protein [Psychrobacillus sp. FJAT-21963]KQL33323.1 hypothetical protein AN959_17320 [Psychrobacillus sp. FJAT-21963]
MLWLLVLGIAGLFVLIGFGYDYFIRKDFSEFNTPEVNQNVENAKRDAKTVESASFNGFGG